MIYFLTGENWYAREQALQRLVARVEPSPEYLNAERLTVKEFKETLGARTLFSPTRCIVVRQLSENKPVWDALADIADAVSGDVLVIVEDKPDKRTKTYKFLQKKATTKEFPNWTDRDISYATEWMVAEAKERECSLSVKEARLVIQRVGVNQARLAAALDKLSLMSKITPEAIEASVEAYAVDNVFMLLETALRGNVRGVQEMIKGLRQAEDPYRVFGLLGSQLTQFAALVYSNEPPNEVARAIGASPFVLSKLSPFASRQSESGMRAMIEWAAEIDMQMKSVAINPWVLVEQLLLKIASR